MTIVGHDSYSYEIYRSDNPDGLALCWTCSNILTYLYASDDRVTSGGPRYPVIQVVRHTTSLDTYFGNRIRFKNRRR